MKGIILTILFFGFRLALNGQEVSNVEAKAVEDKIQISYVIAGGGLYQAFSARVYVSLDGGTTFTGPLKEITGSVGPGLKNGMHTIIWDAFKELPFTDEQLIFDIRLTVKELDKSRDWMVSLVGNQITPFGLRIGQLGRVGWYLEGRMGLTPMQSAKFTYSNGEIIDFDQPGYIELNQKNNYAAWSVTGGATFQPTWNLFIYTGIGYGREDYLLGVNEYAYQGDQLLLQSQALFKEHSNTGLQLDGGVIYRIKKVVVSAGAYSIGFKTLFWTASIGIVF